MFMAVFQYRAVNQEGVMAEGRVEAGGREEAFRQLEILGLKPVCLEERLEAPPDAEKKFPEGLKRKRVSFQALENFTRQLSSLLAAGVPLSRALHLLCKEASSSSARERWKEVHDLVIDGTSLAEAMARAPDIFPRVYVAMVHAGETGGFLDLVLGQISDFQSREKELKSRILSALIYPMVLLTLACGVLVYLMVFFIPRFKIIFAGFGASLPWLTRQIVALSEAVIRYGIFAALVGVAAVFLIRKVLRMDQGRRVWERWLLKIPVIGSLTARFAMTRFCRMLGTLIGAGVPLISALRVARESIGNQTLVDAVDTSIERVQQGDRLAASLSGCPELFPSSVLEMISVAEETGRLDKELVRLAQAAEGDLDRQLKTSVALVEPLMLFVMAGFIGMIFIGMVIPIFTIQEYIK
jgi:type II secretory pathway component PulF